METVTKRDLVVEISEQTDLTQHQVFEVVQSLLDTVSEHLSKGDQVVLRNFGTFQVRKAKAKVGRNPNKKGSEVQIPERAVVRFRPGKELKEEVAKVLPLLD